MWTTKVLSTLAVVGVLCGSVVKGFAPATRSQWGKHSVGRASSVQRSSLFLAGEVEGKGELADFPTESEEREVAQEFASMVDFPTESEERQTVKNLGKLGVEQDVKWKDPEMAKNTQIELSWWAW